MYKSVIRSIFSYRLAAAAVAGLALAAGASAHHSFAVHFTADEVITVEGVVTEFSFSNPHGQLFWTATNADGEAEEWSAETNSPNILRRRGWSKESIQPGDAVTVTGFPSRDGSNYMRINRLDFADGRVLQGQSAAAQD
jgi:hypothetical protein